MGGVGQWTAEEWAAWDEEWEAWESDTENGERHDAGEVSIFATASRTLKVAGSLALPS